MQEKRFRVKKTEFKTARVRESLKQTDLIVSGLSQPEISRLEMGKCSVSEHEARLLALILKTPMAWIFTEEKK